MNIIPNTYLAQPSSIILSSSSSSSSPVSNVSLSIGSNIISASTNNHANNNSNSAQQAIAVSNNLISGSVGTHHKHNAANVGAAVQLNNASQQQQQLIIGEHHHRLHCVICEDVLDSTSNDNSIAMLAVRPSIGAPAGSPFFPILEKLSHSSSSSVPCCGQCSISMLKQWNDFEAKNVPIKNRVYNLNSNKNSRQNSVAQQSSQQQQQQPSTSSHPVQIISSQDGALDLSMPTSQQTKPIQHHRTKLSLKSRRSAPTNRNSVAGNAGQYQTMSNILTKLSSSSPPIVNKKQCFSCALCEDKCQQLLQISLRHIPNCPYFPTLAPYISSSLIDHNGRINVCESCHRQLIQQWDIFQKANQPVNERVYQVVNNNFKSKANEQLLLSRTNIPQNIAGLTASQFITISNSQQTNAKEFFQCEICHKDLLMMAASSLPSDTQSQTAISMQTEIDSNTVMNSAATIMKKLIVSSAQNINLLSFVNTNASSAAVGQQIQALIDSGRVLTCLKCFENFASISGVTVKPAINGKISIINVETTTDNKPVSSIAPDSLCVGCRFNKAQHLVETKETPNKEPFYPFLRESSEPSGLARVCAACHLMLETQWDAFEAAYIPFAQRTYRLTNTTPAAGSNFACSKTVPTILKRPSSSSLSSSGSSSSTATPIVIAHSNGAISNVSTPPTPLKIQISSPSVITTAGTVVPTLAQEKTQLLLTTVNSDPSTVVVGQPATAALSIQTPPLLLPDNDRILHVINEFLAKLGGPSPMLAAKCSVCQEFSKKGETYHLCSSPQKILLSRELGFYPFFPMLGKTQASRKRSLTYKSIEALHPVCAFCYHSLIAQWAAYHLSLYPEDIDPKNRIYNCRNFICYVCGVTTYRTRVRSISVKDFPFLIEHKRPPGALSLFKGNNVVTCLDCFNTLTHQWVENERMKVPLEMRQYNWMPSPQPPPPPPPAPSLPSATAQPLSQTHQNDGSVAESAHNSRPSSTSSVAVAAAAAQLHNVHSSHLILAQNGGTPVALVPSKSPAQFEIVNRTQVLHPSHTLAPLVAAAMAAQPVTIDASSIQLQPAGNASSFADALRHLARQQTNHHSHSSSPASSSNLSTLASVALSRTGKPIKTKPKNKKIENGNENHDKDKKNNSPKIEKQKPKSIVDVLVERRKNRIAERKQKIAQDSSQGQMDEMSVISGDDKELEDLAALEDDDEEDDFDDFDDRSDLESVNNFIEEVSRCNNSSDNHHPEKEDFLFSFGLVTDRKKAELEFSRYMKDKLSRRLSHYSYKLDLIQEQDFSDYEDDNESLSCLEPVDDIPTFENIDPKKDALMEAVGLKRCRNAAEILKREITWLEILQDRKNRKAKGIVCIGKIYNNFTDKALAKLFKKLLPNCKAGSKIPPLEYIRSLINNENLDFEPEIKPEIDQQHVNHLQLQPHQSQQQQLQKQQPPAIVLETSRIAEVNVEAAPGTNTVLRMPINNVINSKKFAQEFHQSVLMETQKKQANKPQNSSIANDKCAEKREQMAKLQQRLTQIDSEQQYLFAKKIEIETSLRRLDDERTGLQSELERISQSADGDVNSLRV